MGNKSKNKVTFKEFIHLVSEDIKDRLTVFRDKLIDNGRIVFPVLLVLLAVLTLFLAHNARAKVVAASVEIDDTISKTIRVVGEVMNVPFEEDAYPALNQLIYDYYEALAYADVEAITNIQSAVSNTEVIRLGKMADYIDRYENIKVYSKPGPYENTFIAYVYSDVFLKGREEATPGLQAFYIDCDEYGGYFINNNQLTADEAEYIRAIALQGDSIDLKNSVNVSYQNLMEENAELNNFWAELSVQIDLAVGEELALDALLQAQLAEGDTGADSEGANEGAGGNTTTSSSGTIKVRTTASVNVRKSASQTADKIGTASAGTTFVLIEEMINGWSKIKYEKSEGFIKTEYLEKLENVDDLSVIGKATATTGLNVRSEPNQTSTKLGTLSRGQTVELIIIQDGWCKIKFKGQVGYVKADYVTIE